MPNKVDLTSTEFQAYFWKALQFFNLYRLSLTTVLILLQQTGLSPKFLGLVHPTAYLWIISIYFLFAILMIPLLIKRIPGYKWSVIIQISFDILAVVLMVHTSGGLNNGLGVLLAVSVGTSSLLIGSTRALVVPAVATLALFAEGIFARFHDLHVLDFSQPALLGGSFFIISILSLTLARRLHQSEQIAIESKANLASMEAVSDNIIQTMTIGVVIVDEDNNVRLINDAAWKSFGMPSQPQAKKLESLSKELHKQLFLWRINPSNPITKKLKMDARSDVDELQIRFRQMGEAEHNLVLIFLEDTSILNEKAQQLKLSSLGRLTASIAHEIRNPLGAISHAAQLLEESENINESDRHLCEMITKHSRRMNHIIENVMNLSQRRAPQHESIELKLFLELYIEELMIQNKDNLDINLEVMPDEIEVIFDRSQLLQVMANLCGNGLRYSLANTGVASLKIIAAKEYGSELIFLDIIDSGPGISETDADKLFEPFYTTSEHGTGLGLYLARELCEANGARLNYLPVPTGTGSCFRLVFPRDRDLD